VAGTGQAAPATIRDRRRYVWAARSLQSGQSVQVATHAAPGYRVWAALRVGDAVCVALVVIEPSLVSQPGR